MKPIVNQIVKPIVKPLVNPIVKPLGLSFDDRVKNVTSLFKKSKNPCELLETIDNIYKLYTEYMIDLNGTYEQTMFSTRIKMFFTNFFSYAIPDDEALKVIYDNIKQYDQILEVGAGFGLWAFLLNSKYNMNIIASDNHESHLSKEEVTLRKFMPIEQIDNITAIKEYKPQVLILIWPPYHNDMAYDSLITFKGDVLVYIGEKPNGVTANEKFFNELGENWNRITYKHIKNWKGINDILFIFHRK